MPPAASMRARDLWRRADLGTVAGGFTAQDVASHAVTAIKLTPVA